MHSAAGGGAKTQGALLDLFLTPLAAAAACPGRLHDVAVPIVLEWDVACFFGFDFGRHDMADREQEIR